MVYIVMTEEIVKIGIAKIVEIREFNLVDKTEVDQGMNQIIGEEVSGTMQGNIKILEDRIVEENIEAIIGMKITVERKVGVDLEKDHFQGIIIIEGMIEAQVISDQSSDQEQVQRVIELGVIHPESVITVQKIVPHPKKKEK